MWVVYWNYCIFLLSLLSPIRFVHVECMKSIQPKQAMCQGLVENEDPFTPQMHLVKNCDHLVNLDKQLCVIPPWITTCPWIYDRSCILDNNPLLIVDDKSPIFFLNKIGDMDNAAMSLLLEDLFIWPGPFNRYQNGVSDNNHIGAHHIFCLYLFT